MKVLLSFDTGLILSMLGFGPRRINFLWDEPNSNLGPSLASEIKDTYNIVLLIILPPAEHIFNLAKVSCQEVFHFYSENTE